MHGELILTTDPVHADVGSSPRAWGTHLHQSPSQISDRFIPTCMGNSGSNAPKPSRRAVHPHVHGELGVGVAPGPPGVGSSPRAWGTRSTGGGWWMSARFIPTCMGNSATVFRVFPHVSVHPHVHGELARGESVNWGGFGSSPRAWGTRVAGLPASAPGRFIPTCMGNSPARSRTSTAAPVHPHVHGELRQPTKTHYGFTGSSPRAWGTPLRLTLLVADPRFIPTCMGNSARRCRTPGG